jgi:limonene-1,2-epoxide hydrolase
VTAEEVVRAELEAWATLDADRIMGHFTTDAVWENVPFGPVFGHDAIRAAVEGFLGQMTRCEIDIINLAVADNIVMTERVDHIIIGGRTTDARCMGTFEVAGDKISAWRDYFDSADEPA